MKSQFRVIAIALLAAAGINGCGGGGGGSEAPVAAAPPPPPPPPPNPSTVDFTSYSRQMYADNETSAAWDVESVTFTFDGDDDPAAYDDLLPTAQ